MASSHRVISLPVAVHVEPFRWQLDLFWFGHRQVYGHEARLRTLAIIVKRNKIAERKVGRMSWNIDVPHSMCEAFFDIEDIKRSVPPSRFGIGVPLNIQTGLMQILPRFSDGQLLEVIDCDMFHFRPCPLGNIRPYELIVSDVYENWHLFSLSKNRHIISPYFENEGRYYNGGFVPIIGLAATFRRILPEWTAIHIDILRRDYGATIHWWAGMFALQAACEKARVQMIGRDFCYVPDVNTLTPNHYIGHYSVDHLFDKRKFPSIDQNEFPTNPYYQLITNWIRQHKQRDP